VNVIQLATRPGKTGVNNVVENIQRLLDIQTLFIFPTSSSKLTNFIKSIIVIRNFKKNGFIVISHGLLPDIINSFVSQNSISYIHNYIYNDYRYKFGILSPVLTTIHLLAIKNIEKKISCGKSVAQHIYNTYSIKSQVLANIPTNILAKNPTNSNRSFYYAGPLIKRKNIVNVVDCIIKNNYKINFTIFGHGELKNKITKIINNDVQERNFTIIIKTISNPTKAYNLGDFYVSFSRAEGLPLGVLEAIASGCIPILSSIDSHKEILEQFDEYLPGTFESIKEGISWGLSLTDDQRINLGKALQNKALKIFNEATFRKNLIKIIHE